MANALPGIAFGLIVNVGAAKAEPPLIASIAAVAIAAVATFFIKNFIMYPLKVGFNSLTHCGTNRKHY